MPACVRSTTTTAARCVGGDARLSLRARARATAPPLLTVLGGKLTTYRRLAEAALAKLAPHFPGMGPAWTARQPAAGRRSRRGRPCRAYRRACAAASAASSGISRPPGAPLRDARRRGAGRGAQRQAISGAALGGGLTEREVIYLARREWAREPEDVLWRRTKCGLHMTRRGSAIAAADRDRAPACEQLRASRGWAGRTGAARRPAGCRRRIAAADHGPCTSMISRFCSFGAPTSRRRRLRLAHVADRQLQVEAALGRLMVPSAFMARVARHRLRRSACA